MEHLLFWSKCSIIYPGDMNYRYTNCLRKYIKQIILQKLINNILFNYLFIPSIEINDIRFKIKFNLLKTVFKLDYPSKYFECPLSLITGAYVNKCFENYLGIKTYM